MAVSDSLKAPRKKSVAAVSARSDAPARTGRIRSALRNALSSGSRFCGGCGAPVV